MVLWSCFSKFQQTSCSCIPTNRTLRICETPTIWITYASHYEKHLVSICQLTLQLIVLFLSNSIKVMIPYSEVIHCRFMTGLLKSLIAILHHLVKSLIIFLWVVTAIQHNRRVSRISYYSGYTSYILNQQDECNWYNWLIQSMSSPIK